MSKVKIWYSLINDGKSKNMPKRFSNRLYLLINVERFIFLNENFYPLHDALYGIFHWTRHLNRNAECDLRKDVTVNSWWEIVLRCCDNLFLFLQLDVLRCTCFNFDAENVGLDIALSLFHRNPLAKNIWILFAVSGSGWIGKAWIWPFLTLSLTKLGVIIALYLSGVKAAEFFD